MDKNNVKISLFFIFMISTEYYQIRIKKSKNKEKNREKETKKDRERII